MNLPGCKRQRQLRGWSVGELAEHAGLDPKVIWKAESGRSVSEPTARKLAQTFAKNPVPPGMAELMVEAVG